MVPMRLAESDDFSKMLKFIVANARSFDKSSDSDLRWPQRKFEKIQVQQFYNSIVCISKIIDDTQKFYLSLFGTKLPFILVSHDIWDSKIYQILGVTTKRYNSFPGMVSYRMTFSVK
jgi:hypothetical protein